VTEEQLIEENDQLRSLLEQALLLTEEVAMGEHPRVEAQALLPILQEALVPDSEQDG
jgi:hypothetical protein